MLIKFYYAEAILENYLFSNPIIFSPNAINNEMLQHNEQQTSHESSTKSSKTVTKNNLYESELTFKDMIAKGDSSSVKFPVTFKNFKELKYIFFVMLRFQSRQAFF